MTSDYLKRLNLYDTATREVSEFKSIEPGKVSIYVCGATVQSYPHIGHVRSGVNFDILRRWLIKQGYAVTFIRNVTDIDDKILHKAVHEEMPWWALALKYEPDPVRPAPITEAQVLMPRRVDDRGSDLWSTFNRIQENLVKGGLNGRNTRGRRQSTRPVQGIDQNVRLNRALWMLAEEMRKLKG